MNREARGKKQAGESVGGRFAPAESTEAAGVGLDVDEFGRPPMDLATAKRLVAAEQRDSSEDTEDATDEELLAYAADTVSLNANSPGAAQFEDYGNESSQAWKTFLQHVESVGVAEYQEQHPSPEPHERRVIMALAESGVDIETNMLREAAARNSLLEADLDNIQRWTDRGDQERAHRSILGAVMRAETPARLAEAGVSYPNDWDQMSSSSKDLWEERQLRGVDRRSHSDA